MCTCMRMYAQVGGADIVMNSPACIVGKRSGAFKYILILYIYIVKYTLISMHVCLCMCRVRWGRDR